MVPNRAKHEIFLPKVIHRYIFVKRLRLKKIRNTFVASLRFGYFYPHRRVLIKQNQAGFGYFSILKPYKTDLIPVKGKYKTHEPMFNQCPLCYKPKTSENLLMSLGSTKREHRPNMGQHGIIL